MEVRLSVEAEFQLDELLFYLEMEWGTKVSNTFLEKFLHCLGVISLMPNAYPESEAMPGLHRCVVTYQTSFLYQILENEIEVVTVVDNRRDWP